MTNEDAGESTAGIVNPGTKEAELLDRIVAFYLQSGDFNGLPVSVAHGTEINLATAARLVRKGVVEVIGGKDYPNPHIRPWASKQTVEEQIADLREAMLPDRAAVCLYPKASALASRVDPADYEGRPYELQLALGGTTLQLIYFRADVLEPYREDPRFEFGMEDFGFSFNISDERYLDDDEPEAEKVSLMHGGLAYNFGTKGDGHLKRAVCVFLTDLARFTPEIQTRWSTFQIPDQDEFDRHPVWWRTQMGHFPDGPGPFSRLDGELNALNSLHKNMTGESLFRTTEPPREFGWLLRPSQREFDQFIHNLDKLLSDNLRHKAFDAMGIPRDNEQGDQMGTLKRLDVILERASITEIERREILKPAREVRGEPPRVS